MRTAYLSLGSNTGDRQGNLARALALLSAPDLRVARVSPAYETEPQGVTGRGWFLNLVAEIETDLFPRQLLARCQKVERQLGRRRKGDNSPRSIDIDIVLFGGFVMNDDELTIPHARMHERRFVLEPLADLAPALQHPVLRRSVVEMLAGTRGQAVRRVPGWNPTGS